MLPADPEILEFGPYRLAPRERTLSKGGETVSLTPKVFDLLCYLASHPGRLISREELMKQVWLDSFVEESNLTVSVSVLRKALGDDGGLIQTVPKQGYRFTAEVRIFGEPERTGSIVPNAAAAETEPAIASAIPRRRYGLLAAAGALSALVAAGLWQWTHGSSVPDPPLRVAPLTTDPGLEYSPAISPDGTRVAFQFQKSQADNAGIYVQLIPTGEPVRVSPPDVYATSPAWSPDGASIAYTSLESNVSSIAVVPALGGTARTLTTIGPSAYSYSGHKLHWSPDSKWVLYPQAVSDGPRTYIAAVSLETREEIRLTDPPGTFAGDQHPLLSPDGGTLVFSRFRTTVVGDYYAMKLAPGLKPASEARRITFLDGNGSGAAWVPGTRDIVLASGPYKASMLYRLSISPGLEPAQPRLVNFASDDAMAPAISAATGTVPSRLLFQRAFDQQNIRRLSLDHPILQGGSGEPWAPSTRSENTPAISPDGSKVAFASTRSGSWQIWVCQASGTNCAQVSHLGNTFSRSPSWSPDGKSLVFDSRIGGQSDLYVIPSDGGPQRRLTDTMTNEFRPYWSHDGKYIYFESNAKGESAIWRMPAGGGAAEQVTHEGRAMQPVESSDGRWLYYRNDAPPSIMRMALPGGKPERVIEGQWFDFAPVGESLIIASPSEIVRVSTTGKVLQTLLRSAEGSIDPGNGFAVSPDGKWLLYINLENRASDLFWVDNFR